MSVLIKGGLVVTAADSTVADVYIDGEHVSMIGESLDVAADRTIDATGKYVLPGLVDPHTHLEMPWRGETTVDDFYHGHVAAAFGGTTTHVDFCIQAKGQTFNEALEAWHAKRDGKAIIDNGFHIIVTDLSSGSLDELATLPDEHGVSSYKLFMAYNDSLRIWDEDLFRVMQVAAKTGACVMVHAENGDAIEVLMADAIAAGNTAPVFHALTRPPETEAEATNRAIQLAHVAGAPLYVVHVSCEESLEPIKLARAKGWDTWGETCTQYFFVDESMLERLDGFEAGNYVYTPPPRPKKNQPILWEAVRDNDLQVISTDHCAYSKDQKLFGKDDFRAIPNGAAGMENRLQMVHTFGVREGRITLNRMVELLATNPAKLFGMYPRKGTIAPGCDADIVVFDPEKPHTISAATHHSASDINIYEGTEVVGSPEIVLRRGEVIVDGDKLLAQAGSGQFIRRSKFREELRPAAPALA